MPLGVPVLLLYYIQRKPYRIGRVKTSVNPFEAIFLNPSYYMSCSTTRDRPDILDEYIAIAI